MDKVNKSAGSVTTEKVEIKTTTRKGILNARNGSHADRFQFSPLLFAIDVETVRFRA